MRRILSLVLLLMVILPVDGAVMVRQEIYSKAVPSDEGIYVYFSGILKDAEKCLNKFLDEDRSALNLSTQLEHKVWLIEEESRFYAARGVKTNVTLVVKPFLSLVDEIKKLIEFQSVFLKNAEELLRKKNYLAYTRAESAVISMKIVAKKINGSVDEIEKIELWNGSSKLRFNVSKLRSELKEVFELIAYYERSLARFGRTGIVVAVSNYRPFLYQEITIYVYARNVTPTALFIDDVKYELKGDTFKHSFKKLGEHTIYAEGVNNGRVFKSNIVRVYVTKIPTYIVLSSKSAAFLNENVRVTGYLSDYYGNPLDANVTVKVDGREIRLNAEKGLFTFNVTRRTEGFLNVSAFYSGNETYASSVASESIFFSRFPVSVYIKADRTRIGANQTVNFTCIICGVNGSIPVRIFVNSGYVKTLNLSDHSKFKLNFSDPGLYKVFAYFPGNSLYKPAKSNVVEITVAGFRGFAKVNYALAVAVAAVAVATAYTFARNFRARRGEARSAEVKEGETPKVGMELPESVEEAYRMLFDVLTSRYNFRRSLTPRELLKSLEKSPFAEKLKIVTELHEKTVYGCVALRDDEREMYFKLVSEILSEMG